MRSLTPLEVAISIAVAGSVLAASTPAFVRNLHASRLTEPIDGLGRIAGRAAGLAAGAPAAAAYPESVPLTPEKVAQGESVSDPPGTWNHPTWRKLGFEWTVPHYYSFAFESRNAPDRAVFHARAHGDLDGDGVLSTFAISGESRQGGVPTNSALDVHREIE
jgi:hypothetical protein